MVKKILIVIGIVTVWECREGILPAIESVVHAITETGSSLLQSA
jgi:hypothetical protein